jgi:hypothetical protein
MRATGLPEILLPQKNTLMAATRDPDRRDGRDRRRWSRYDVDGEIGAELVTEDGRIACRIENVSLAGAKLRMVEPAQPVAGLRLDYHGQSGPSGRCVWSNSDSIGVKFEFSDESVALALACIRHTAPNAAEPSDTI